MTLWHYDTMSNNGTHTHLIDVNSSDSARGPKWQSNASWNSNTWWLGFLSETPDPSNQIAWWILIESTRIWGQLLARSGRKSNKILPHYIWLECRLTERGVKSWYGEDLLSSEQTVNFIKVSTVLEADELLEGLSYKFCVMFTGVLPCLQHQLQCLFRCWDS